MVICRVSDVWVSGAVWERCEIMQACWWDDIRLHSSTNMLLSEHHLFIVQLHIRGSVIAFLYMMCICCYL